MCHSLRPLLNMKCRKWTSKGPQMAQTQKILYSPCSFARGGNHMRRCMWYHLIRVGIPIYGTKLTWTFLTTADRNFKDQASVTILYHTQFVRQVKVLFHKCFAWIKKKYSWTYQNHLPEEPTKAITIHLWVMIQVTPLLQDLLHIYLYIHFHTHISLVSMTKHIWDTLLHQTWRYVWYLFSGCVFWGGGGCWLFSFKRWHIHL